MQDSLESGDNGMAATSDPIQLFTKQHATYERFIHLVRYPHGIRSFFLESPLLESGFRVLDAGCGTGVITIALNDALMRRSMPVESLHAFDLTPAMLEHFAAKLRARGGPVVELRQANVLKPETLPDDWSGYDLIVSASMLEYVPREQLADALSNLRQRLGRHGTLIVFITKRNWLTRPLVGSWWQSNLYERDGLQAAFQRAGFGDVEFAGFPAAAAHLSLWGHILVARCHRQGLRA